MDLATLIGFIAAVGVVITAILLGGNFAGMFDLHALLIVVGGSASVILMRFSLKQLAVSLQIGLTVLFYKAEEPHEIIKEVVLLADQARKNGILSLEEVEIRNKFLKHGIRQLIDGMDPDVVETMLTKDMDLAVERHLQGQQIFKALSEVAPAMGLIGTLIGLVQMLSNLNEPSTLGPSMAIAMLATLYGAVLANLIGAPIADKLEMRIKEERIIKSMIIDAVMCIQRGQNPRIIGDFLKIYLPDSKRNIETTPTTTNTPR